MDGYKKGLMMWRSRGAGDIFDRWAVHELMLVVWVFAEVVEVNPDDRWDAEWSVIGVCVSPPVSPQGGNDR